MAVRLTSNGLMGYSQSNFFDQNHNILMHYLRSGNRSLGSKLHAHNAINCTVEQVTTSDLQRFLRLTYRTQPDR
jgi:hypothetical protein